MDTGLLTVLICLGIMVILNLQTIYSGWRDGKFKFGLKKALNQTAPLIYIISYVYVCLFFIALIAVICESPLMEDPSWAIAVTPTIWIILFLGLVIKVGSKLPKKLVKYNEQEIKWHREEIEKWRNRMPKFLKWLYKQPIKDSSIL